MSKKFIPAVILQVLLCLLVAFTPSVKKKALAENGTEYSIRVRDGWFYYYGDESFSDEAAVELNLEDISIPGGYSSYSADNETGFLYLNSTEADGGEKYSGYCTCRLTEPKAAAELNSLFGNDIYNYSENYTTSFQRFLRSHEVMVNFKVYKGDMLFYCASVDGVEIAEYLAGISAEN